MSITQALRALMGHVRVLRTCYSAATDTCPRLEIIAKWFSSAVIRVLTAGLTMYLGSLLPLALHSLSFRLGLGGLFCLRERPTPLNQRFACDDVCESS